MSKLCARYEFEPFFVVMLKVHPVDPRVNRHLLLRDRKIQAVQGDASFFWAAGYGGQAPLALQIVPH